jgi:hypothetical protein
MFYQLTGLNKLPFFLVALIQFPLTMYIIYKIGLPERFHIINTKNVIVYISILLLGMYMSMHTKEFINFIYVALIVYILQKSKYSLLKKVLMSFGLFFFFGFFFRPYYALIPIISLGMYFFTFIKLKNKTISIVIYSIMIAVFISLSHGLVKGKFISESTREEVNFGKTKDIDTAVVSPVENHTWYGELITVFYSYFTVNIPFEAFKFIKKPQVVAFIIWQLVLYYILLKLFSYTIKNKDKDKLKLWVFLFLFSYFVVQGLFEPELGSANRHRIGVLPLIYFALYYDTLRKKI